MALILHSSAFKPNDEIPRKYTCQGDDISPPLGWEGVPAAAQSLVLIMDDPDAPDPKAPETIWVHWLLYNLPPDCHELPEHMTTEKLPAGTLEGLNDWKRTGYGGPCPPQGRHRYFHRLYALDTRIQGLINPTRRQLEAAMLGHVLAQGELMGSYQKS